jgi:hypothetical protein
MEGIELVAALALLLGADLTGTCQSGLEGRFKLGVVCDLAADIANDPAEPAAQQPQLLAMAVELLCMGVASRHHRRPLGDAQIGLPKPHPVPRGEPVQAADRGVQQFGVGREADGFGLHRGVDRDPGQVLAA